MKEVNVVAAIICDGDKILVSQRGYGDFHGMWEFPGGKIELGEAHEKALKREIQEELAISINVGEWVGTVEYDYPAFHIIMRCFICSIDGSEISLNEHEDAKWVTYSELKVIDLLPADALFIEENNWRLEFKIKHQNNRIQQGDLHAYVSDGTKTLNLMDDFEGKLKNSKGPYKRLIFKNGYDAVIGDYQCRYHLIVERFPDIKHMEGNITFSEFKKNKGHSVYQYCNTQLREALKKNGKVLKKKEFYFLRPFYLRAQNSGNREGYGWEWDWSGGVGTSYEGTLYGDTDNYGFVGVEIESVNKREKPVKEQQTRVTSNLRVELTLFQGKKYYKIYKSETESFLIPFSEGMTKEKAINIYQSYMKESL